MGVVTTLDRFEGLLMVRATPDTMEEVCKILADLPVKIEFVHNDRQREKNMVK